MKYFKSLQSIITSVLLILVGVFVGYYLGVRGYEVRVKKDIRDIEVVNKDQDIPDSVDFAKFWMIWDEVNESHIKKPLNPEILVDGAIHGMVEAVGDPYTTYLNLEQNEVAQDSLNGRYEGIGAQLGYSEDERLIIVAPLDGSPAEKVGIIAGDMILEIEEESTQGLSITEAVNRIRGEAGTVSHLTLFREGKEEPFDVFIERDKIKVKSVTWEDKGDGIAYVRLARFGEATNSEWTTAMNEIKYQMPVLNGIVLDVRNNPGGYLDSAVYIVSEFVDEGMVVSEDFSDGSSQKFTVNRKGIFTDKNLPLAVLVNEGSASASEIVAAALKESRDATIVGKRSFGKGSVQKSEQYPDNTALHVTIAKWITPAGNWIDSANSEYKDSEYNETDEDGNEKIGGIKPDEIVEITDEDIQNQFDAQLDKAVKLLKGEE